LGSGFCRRENANLCKLRISRFLRLLQEFGFHHNLCQTLRLNLLEHQVAKRLGNAYPPAYIEKPTFYQQKSWLKPAHMLSGTHVNGMF
jgi:hypothetical protein